LSGHGRNLSPGCDILTPDALVAPLGRMGPPALQWSRTRSGGSYSVVGAGEFFPLNPARNLAPRSPVSGTLMPNFGFTGSHPPNYEGTDDGRISFADSWLLLIP
jgi:hypothetical protein